MSAERHYTVDPINVEGDGFTVEGLQATLDHIHVTWGGKPREARGVSPSLSLGGGAAIIQVEGGRVMLIRDDVANQLAKARAKAEQDPDGRTRQFTAQLHIARVLSASRAEEVLTQNIEGEGLLGLFFAAAMLVQNTIGDVPDCMSLESCEQRERSIRAQISRARTQKRETAGIHFPSSDIANFFEIPTRPGVYYRCVVLIQTGVEQKPMPEGELPFANGIPMRRRNENAGVIVGDVVGDVAEAPPSEGEEV